MSQPISNWALEMQRELDAWLAEPDPVTKARMKAAWQAKLFEPSRRPKVKDHAKAAAGDED